MTRTEIGVTTLAAAKLTPRQGQEPADTTAKEQRARRHTLPGLPARQVSDYEEGQLKGTATDEVRL